MQYPGTYLERKIQTLSKFLFAQYFSIATIILVNVLNWQDEVVACAVLQNIFVAFASRNKGQQYTLNVQVHDINFYKTLIKQAKSILLEWLSCVSGKN